MPIIKPFQGVRAEVSKAARLISRSYDLYDVDELKSELTYNPFSFLHILNPGFKFHHVLKGEERFTLVKNRYHEFKEEGYLIQDELPSLYIYENTDKKHQYTGIIAATSIADFKANLIKKHEDTLEPRVALFKDYLQTVGFNAEPVLITYPDQETIATIIDLEKEKIPVYHFSTADFVVHKLWVISNPETINSIQEAFKSIDSLYIADGHHRSKSSQMLAEQMLNGDSYQYFMSYIIPESQLQITEFNRLVTDLNNHTKEEFLIQLDTKFRLQNRGLEPYKPSKKHHFSMYLDGDFYSLYLRKDLFQPKTLLEELDPQMLFDMILKPILGIQDLRNDTRITYSSGKDDLMRMKTRVDSGEFAVGFNMGPVTVDELKAIADADLRMPPKSTYIKPKLPSGLTIYQF